MITKLKDLGMVKGRRYYEVQCSGCDAKWAMQAGQFKAGYTNWCVDCGKAERKRKQND